MKTLVWILGVLGLGCLPLTAAAPQLEVPITPGDPVAAGRELVGRLLALRPSESVTNEALLHVRVNRTNQFEVPVRIEVAVTPTNWTTTYFASSRNGADQSRLAITQCQDYPNQYYLWTDHGDSVAPLRPVGAATMMPWSHSDFWLADLGMEFLHWPTQRLLKKELCRGQSCDKLESLAPPGQTNGYVRVLSWLDIDTGGPVLAEAYDAAGRFVKEFKPNDFKKVNGLWQLQEMEISNRRTGSRSTLHFKLGSE